MTTKAPFTYPDDEYELSPETSLESTDSLDIPHATSYTTHLLTGRPVEAHQLSPKSKLNYILPRPFRRWYHLRQTHSKRRSRCCGGCSRRWLLRKFIILAYSFFAVVITLCLVGFTLFPSYTKLPPHYAQLKKSALESSSPGRGNPGHQKVFIASSLFDPGGRLVGGPWADNLLQLIELLGPDNTYLSIYENDSGPEGRDALFALKDRLSCKSSLVFDEHLGLDGMPHVTIPDGTERVKRIAYLAAVRNKALAPLDNSETQYDKVLYLNDVYFDPVDVLQLLFSTNQDQYGVENYRAACAVDFINAFKFYDTFATRDLGGYSMGIPFYPWFSYHGDPRSHQDVVQGLDAVRVRSCWGGMVAFDARYFQPQSHLSKMPDTAASLSPSNITAPYRFRAEEDLYWDASECCLINADIQSPDPDVSGIYMNPFVRVAYTPRTLSWLWFTRRFEQLYTPIHFLLDFVFGFPTYNARRGERAWEEVEEVAWVSNSSSPEGGAWKNIPRLASHAGFCGRRSLPVMKDHFTSGENGERNYEGLPVPPIP